MPKKIQKQVIDGKVDELTQPATKTKRPIRSIDELLGRTSSPYSVGNVNEYETKIKAMASTDLERHATEMGILPNSNRTTLLARLITQYNKTSGGYLNTSLYNSVEPKVKSREALLKVLERAK